MNRIVAIALFTLAAMVASSSAIAQRNVIEVNVPFNFTVNNTHLPAGAYTFGSDSLYPDLLIIRDRTKNVKARYLGQRGSIGAGKPHSLIFLGYGGRYFLSEVRFDSAANGIFLPAANSERQARKAKQNEDFASIVVH